MELKTIAAYMHEHGLKLVTAESCTAGLIAARLADEPGAGALLDCAFVTYSSQSKQRCLSVRAETLSRYNLTSEEVAREMAQGAIQRGHANIAIANTGVTDATDPDIEPGTQCFAWLIESPDKQVSVVSETRVFPGQRNDIREAAARYALQRISHYHALSSAHKQD